MTDLQIQLRKDSGEQIFNDKLASFLYDLMRDHLPSGVVQKLVEEATDKDTMYTNGFLAKYAMFLSAELKG